VNDDSVAFLQQTAVASCDAVIDFAASFDERLLSDAESHVRMVEILVPVENDFGLVAFRLLNCFLGESLHTILMKENE
jgi:hypothetical protein